MGRAPLFLFDGRDFFVGVNSIFMGAGLFHYFEALGRFNQQIQSLMVIGLGLVVLYRGIR